MVEVKLTGKCDGCPKFDPIQECLYLNDGRVMSFIVCENQNLCDHLERYLKETFNNEQKEI